MNGEQENLFDAHLLKTFKVGDLVSWTHLVGMIKNMDLFKRYILKVKGINRKFIFAKVIKTDGSYEPFNLSYLTKESNKISDIR